jgi:hypothetical protein
MSVTCLEYNRLECCYCRLLEAGHGGIPRSLGFRQGEWEVTVPCSSESDGLFWTGEQGSFGMGHGIFRHQVFGSRLGRQ